MRAVVIAVMLAGVWSMGAMHMPALGQEQADTVTDLQDARDALEAEPGNEEARKAFITELRKAISATRRAGDADTSLMLADEYISILNLRLITNPADITGRWERFSILLIKYQILYQQAEDLQATLDTVRAAEKDVRFLARERPNTKRYKEELARMLTMLGHFTKSVPDADFIAADAAYAEAVALAEPLLKDNPASLHGAFAKAYGLWWNAGYEANQKKTYEAYEAAIPLYEDAALAFKRLEELAEPNKGYAVDHAAVWYGLGQTYGEVGDDEEAFKAYRFSYQLLKNASAEFPEDSVLYRQSYQLGLFVSYSLKMGEEQLAWLEKMKAVLLEAEATGRLHPEDKRLLGDVDKQIKLNKEVIDANGG